MPQADDTEKTESLVAATRRLFVRDHIAVVVSVTATKSICPARQAAVAILLTPL
jgi:hypothetical protein